MEETRYVTYDRWDAEHGRLKDRLDALERDVEALTRADEARRSRQWTLAVAFLTGVILPLVVAAIIAWASARG